MIVSSGFPVEFTRQETRRSLRRVTIARAGGAELVSRVLFFKQEGLDPAEGDWELSVTRTQSVTVLGLGLKSFQSDCLSFFSGSCRQPYSFVGSNKPPQVRKSRRKSTFQASITMSGLKQIQSA
jgi:hypothetical protein